MATTGSARLAAVFDDATLERLAFTVGALPGRMEALVSAGVETLEEAVEHLGAAMERQSALARDLILRQPPRKLLGYVWSSDYMSILGEMEERGDGYRPDKARIDSKQFLLEHVHAAWSSCGVLAEEGSRLDEGEVAELIGALEELRHVAMLYCMMRSMEIAVAAQDVRRGDMAMRAMATWVNLRGRRYQVQEKEFLELVLRPHDAALRRCYAMGPDAIATGLQAIVSAARSGFADAGERFAQGMHAVSAGDLDEVGGNDFVLEMAAAMDDLVNGGICNLSRHTALTAPLLEDLCFSPGEETGFLEEGPLQGTPLRTMPALVKPGIRLGDDYYVTDGQFVRDVAYRTIQRGLLAREPGYREGWNERQKLLVEEAFTTIFSSQLAGAARYGEAFYRDADTGNWAETDLVIVMEDVLLVVEAKAGVMAMESPAVDFDRHMASVERLIVRAHGQCGRFLRYLAGANTVPIHALRDGRHIQVAELRVGDFRRVLPIGLTVEALAPFSTCLTNLEGIALLPGEHAFMSMSVDDLLILNRFLPTTGELLHYLDARQRAGAVPDTMLLDETEYLGAYISRNRFDMELEEQREQAPFVMWNSFSDVVDKYFEGERAGTGPVPRQRYPSELAGVLRVMDRKRPMGWLGMDAALRNLDDESRNRLSGGIAGMKASLGRHECQWLGVFNGEALQVCVCRSGAEPTEAEARRRSEVACIAAGVPRIRLLRLSYKKRKRLRNVLCKLYGAPATDRHEYHELARAAAAQRGRRVEERDLGGIDWG